MAKKIKSNKKNRKLRKNKSSKKMKIRKYSKQKLSGGNPFKNSNFCKQFKTMDDCQKQCFPHRLVTDPNQGLNGCQWIPGEREGEGECKNFDEHEFGGFDPDSVAKRLIPSSICTL